MGFFDFLFGEGPSTTTSVLDTLTPEQQAALNSLLRELGGSREGFGGDTSIDPSDLSQLSLSALEARALELGNPNRENELSQSAADTLLRFLDLDSNEAGIEDFFQTNIRDPALQEFQESILPAISRDFGGANFFSSERRTSDSDAQGDLIRSLTQARSGLAFNARESDRNRALQALGLAPSIDALGRGDTNELLALLQAGDSQTALGERNFEREFQQFLAEAGIDQNRIQQLLAGINTQAFENVVTSDPGSSGFIVDLIGAFGGSNPFNSPPSTTVGGTRPPPTPPPT